MTKAPDLRKLCPNRPSRAGSPHPVPGGGPGTILSAVTDEIPGQRGLWIAFTRLGRANGTLVRLRGDRRQIEGFVRGEVGW